MRRTLLCFKATRSFGKQKNISLLFATVFLLVGSYINAQGTWTQVSTNCPAGGGGALLVLSDGSVICKTTAGGSDGIGSIWYKLKPDSHGSYINGTWSALPAMINTRLYFSSQILKDGRVYVAGGEYGTGGSSGETYNPLTNAWTATPAVGAFVSDANSEILENGNVLQAIVQGNPFLRQNKLYDPTSNAYSAAPSCIGYHNESSWVKLPDNSIIMVDRNAVTSERYIPAMNQWIADSNVPVSLYDPYGLETGAALLLPDGRAFFIGSLGHTAYYTPSGTTAPGVWAAGPDIPNAQGQPDAPAAIMPNGKILLTCSPVPTSVNHFPAPTSYYEFDYKTNTYTRINAPAGGLTTNVSCYTTSLIDLPDGNVLYSLQGSPVFYVYTPGGTPVASGKPKISNIGRASGGSYRITGTQFNGISEGASYGDDFQMATNFPIVKLTSGNTVLFARTFNWNSTGVMRGTKKDTVYITPPAGIVRGTTYQLTVVANGISSDPLTVNTAALMADEPLAATSVHADDIAISSIKTTTIYPNPAKNQTTLHFSVAANTHVTIKIMDINGKEQFTVVNGNKQKGDYTQQINTSKLSPGTYIVNIITSNGTTNAKLVVQ